MSSLRRRRRQRRRRQGAPEGSLTLPEFIYETYNSLLENGWKMQDIDGMDMLGYLRIRAWKAGREKKKAAPQRRFIDEVWGNMTATEV